MNIDEEISKSLSSLLDQISHESLGYKEFCDRCIAHLKKSGVDFAIDFPHLESALVYKSDSFFVVARTTQTRKREIFCFKQIIKLFKSYCREIPKSAK